MSFKQIIYSNYYSNHNKLLYGQNSLEKIRSRFPVFKYYYQRHLPADKSSKMLDIGCGDGNFVYWLQETGYTEAFGLDISQQQIDEGLKLGIKNLSCADLKDYLKNSAHCFDTIFARDVIEHFTRDEVFEIMNMVREKLKPGGKFIIQVPNGQGLFHTSIFYGDYTHEMPYTSSSINQIILNTGFKGSYCFSAGPVPTGVVSSLRFVLWKFKELQLRFWKGVETGNPSGIFTQNLIAVISN